MKKIIDLRTSFPKLYDNSIEDILNTLRSRSCIVLETEDPNTN